jgi:hypothetical protein
VAMGKARVLVNLFVFIITELSNVSFVYYGEVKRKLKKTLRFFITFRLS